MGTRVVSERWGEGTVQRYDGDQVTVLFDEHGYRELYLPVVRDHGLLHAAGGTPGAPDGLLTRRHANAGPVRSRPPSA